MSCAVCLEPIETSVVLECAHEYCKECAARWLSRKSTCPTCRREIDEQTRHKIAKAGGLVVDDDESLSDSEFSILSDDEEDDAMTPLQIAARFGWLSEIRQLVRDGVEPDEERCFWSPLCVAAYYLNADAVSLLVQLGASLRYRTASDTTVMWYALQSNGSNYAILEIVELLLRLGVRINSRIDGNRSTALIWATRRNRYDIVRYLLTVPRIYVNARDTNGLTALHYAAAGPSRTLVDLLINYGARM